MLYFCTQLYIFKLAYIHTLGNSYALKFSTLSICSFSSLRWWQRRPLSMTMIFSRSLSLARCLPYCWQLMQKTEANRKNYNIVELLRTGNVLNKEKKLFLYYFIYKIYSFFFSDFHFSAFVIFVVWTFPFCGCIAATVLVSENCVFFSEFFIYQAWVYLL